MYLQKRNKIKRRFELAQTNKQIKKVNLKLIIN